jgi:hypothetical protein
MTSGHLTEHVDSAELVFLDGPADVDELNAQLAYFGFRVVGRSLVQMSSHHPIERPDELGRPTEGVPFIRRSLVHLHIEFYRVGVNVDVRNAAAAASGQVQRFSYLTTPGINVSVGNTSERAFSESVVLGSSDAAALQGVTQFREAGLTFDGTIGIVQPYTRISGEVVVSSFLGSGIERASVDIPIELDAVLGRWVTVATIDAADVNAGIAFQSFGWTLDAGAERIVVRVRVDPHTIDVAEPATHARPSKKRPSEDVADDRSTPSESYIGSHGSASDHPQRSRQPHAVESHPE